MSLEGNISTPSLNENHKFSIISDRFTDTTELECKMAMGYGLDSIHNL